MKLFRKNSSEVNQLNSSVILLFVDFETTSNNGLECDPIEAYYVATNSRGDVLDKTGFIYKTQTLSQLLYKIKDPNIKSFYERNGLLGEYDASSFITHSQIDSFLCDWVTQLINQYECDRIVLCGYVTFLDKQMIQLFHPKLYKLLYYKSIDLASIEVMGNVLANNMVDNEKSFDSLFDSSGRTYHRAEHDVMKTIENYRNNCYLFSPKQ